MGMRVARDLRNRRFGRGSVRNFDDDGHMLILPTIAPATDAEIPAPAALAAASYPTVATAAASATARTNSFLGL